jgi:hypothetical protein
MLEEAEQKLKRLEEEVAQEAAQADDIDLATFALAQAAQHL